MNCTIVSIFLFLTFFTVNAQHIIDRKAVVSRHNVHLTKPDSLSSLTVGNGAFAFTVDVTGLQSFPLYYKKGIALGTESDWGWHSFPNKEGWKEDEFYKAFNFNGSAVPYAVQWNEPQRNMEAANYFRQNPHRLQLGNVGMELIKKNGQRAGISDLKNIDQTLNLWTGEIKSIFTLENDPVEVITYAHHQNDAVGAKVNSPLVGEGRLTIFIKLPYPTGEFLDAGTNYAAVEQHSSSIISKRINYSNCKT